MTVQDLIKTCNYGKTAQIWYEKSKNRKQITTIDTVENELLRFCRMLSGLTAEPSDDIMIAMLYWQDGEKVVGAELFSKREFNEKVQLSENRSFPAYRENDGKEILNGILEITKEWVPTGYGYEFTPWEDVLGAEVLPDNYSRIGKDEFLADILYEFSFNGMTRESQEKRRLELESSIEEAERLRKFPEKEKYLVSMDTLFKGIFQDDMRTEEVKKEEQRMMYLDSVRTREAWFFEMQKIVGIKKYGR